MRIDRTYRLPADEIYPEKQTKDLIVLHHTVSGSFKSVWSYWNSDKNKDGTKRRVATAYVIDKDGTVYELFDPTMWAHHIGSTLPSNTQANKRSIGIEIVSEGALTLDNETGQFFWLDGQARFPSQTMKIYDNTVKWRGYRYFDAYEEEQVEAAASLVVKLCAALGIPKTVAATPGEFQPGYLSTLKGITTHANLRPDKTDLHPGFPWARFAQKLI